MSAETLIPETPTTETPSPKTTSAENTGSPKGLKAKVEEVRRRSTHRAAEAIGALGDIAAELELQEIAKRFGGVREDLLSDTFKVIVVGRFKNGKSTLLNALLGRPTRPLPAIAGEHGPLPVDNLPATATLTYIRYAEEPWVKAWSFDGEEQEWPLERYLEESTVRMDEEENRRIFQDIRNFELGFPAELCQSGVTLIDSPGTDDVPHRTDITRQALDRADAAIVVFRSDALAGKEERDFVARELLSTKTHLFTVINLFHQQEVNERLRGAAWQRLVTDMMSGPKWQGQDLEEKDIHFVQGLDAEKGKLEPSDELVESSGLLAFEERLGDFLVRDRHRVHLEKFIGAALEHARELEQQVETRRAGLERESAELAEAFEEIAPQLEAIHQRRRKLPKILDRYRRESIRQLEGSFARMVRDLRRDLPIELEKVELESLQGVGGFVRAAFRQKQLCEEMAAACTGIAKERFDVWHKAPATEPGAQQELQPIFDRLMDEVSEEVGEIERGLSDIQLRLTGLKVASGEVVEPVSLKQRAIGILAGVLLQDVSLAAGGGVAGLRGLAGTVGGWVASGIGLGVLSTLGFAIAPLIVPAALIGGLLGSMTWNRVGIEKRLQERTLDQFFEQLDKVPAAAGPRIESGVDQLFAEVEKSLMAELGSAIASEEENVRSMMQLNELSRAEKQSVLEELTQVREAIRRQMDELQEVELNAAQAA
ncbi:MAG: dynamin family protein [Acidobacteriota bacterium]|nr:dynamin family protein [Acidobacteriota bacterium]